MVLDIQLIKGDDIASPDLINPVGIFRRIVVGNSVIINPYGGKFYRKTQILRCKDDRSIPTVIFVFIKYFFREVILRVLYVPFTQFTVEVV